MFISEQKAGKVPIQSLWSQDWCPCAQGKRCYPLIFIEKWLFLMPKGASKIIDFFKYFATCQLHSPHAPPPAPKRGTRPYHPSGNYRPVVVGASRSGALEALSPPCAFKSLSFYPANVHTAHPTPHHSLMQRGGGQGVLVPCLEFP